MLNILFSGLAVLGILLSGWTPAPAQDRDWERAHRIIGKTMEDLRHVEHRDVWAVVERGHYEAAERNLGDISRDLDHNRLDRGRLEAAIRDVESVAHVTKIDPEARDRLNEDLRELRRLRDEWHWR